MTDSKPDARTTGDLTRIALALRAVSLLMAAASFGGAALYLNGSIPVDTGGTAMQIGVAVVLVVGGAASVLGVWRATQRRTGKNGALLVAGAVPVAICFWWTGIVPVAAVSIATLGYINGRRKASIGP